MQLGKKFERRGICSTPLEKSVFALLAMALQTKFAAFLNHPAGPKVSIDIIFIPIKFELSP